MTINLYDVNDGLAALAAEAGVTLTDDTLDALTHSVAGILEAASELSWFAAS